MHYGRWQKNGSPHVATTNRFICDICTKSFEPRNGRQLICDDCRSDTLAFQAWKNAKNLERNLRDPAAYEARRRAQRKRYAASIRAYQLDWQAKNREHVREYGKLYAQRNPGKRREWMDSNRAAVRQWAQRRRARLKDNGVFVVSARDLARLLQRHDFGCAYCGVPFDNDTVTWDHIVPISRGGAAPTPSEILLRRACGQGERRIRPDLN
jgi:5-methylcytosine-specific restriction endonuclease McrA